MRPGQRRRSCSARCSADPDAARERAEDASSCPPPTRHSPRSATRSSASSCATSATPERRCASCERPCGWRGVRVTAVRSADAMATLGGSRCTAGGMREGSATSTRRRPRSAACRSGRALVRRAYVLAHLLARSRRVPTDLSEREELFAGAGDHVWEATRAQPPGRHRRRAGRRSSRPRWHSRSTARSRPHSPVMPSRRSAQHNTGWLGVRPRRPAARARAVRLRRGPLRRGRDHQRRPRRTTRRRPTCPRGLATGTPSTRGGGARRAPAAASRARPTC